MRVAHLENEGRDNLYRRARLAALEKEAQKIPVLEQQVRQLQQRLLVLNPLLAKNQLTSQRVELLEGLFEKTVLADKRIMIFRTSQHVDHVEAAGIGSNISHREGNWGGHVFFRVGSVDAENVGRALIKFNEINSSLFNGKEILAAVLYFKQTENESFYEDDGAVNETIDLYSVRKKWWQGRHTRGKAQKGEVTWISARAQEEDWAVPGCGSPTDDYDPQVLGTTGPTVSGDSSEWVTIILNKEGIRRLEDRSWVNNGFLLKMRDENKPNTAVLFDSPKAKIENMPFMEIYYQDDKSKQERR